jgi:hypothetical protein
MISMVSVTWTDRAVFGMPAFVSRKNRWAVWIHRFQKKNKQNKKQKKTKKQKK